MIILVRAWHASIAAVFSYNTIIFRRGALSGPLMGVSILLVKDSVRQLFGCCCDVNMLAVRIDGFMA